MNSEKKLLFSNLHYDLTELFERTPIFPEPVMRFQDCQVDPNADMILATKMMRPGTDCKEFNRQADRFNEDAQQKGDKNYWDDMQNLVMNTSARKIVMGKKQEYIALHDLDKLKRNNMPFYYIKSDHVACLRNLQQRTKQPQMKKEVEANLKTYEKIMQAYKKANPHLFK